MKLFLKMKAAFAVALIGFSAMLFYACNEVGNGFGVDASGDPIVATVDTNLAEVQKIFVSGKCTQCHLVNGYGWSQTGSSGAIKGLDLTPGNSYLSLLGASGTGQPTFEGQGQNPLYRVRPGSADSSYLYQKISAGPYKSGGRMPLTFSPLSDAEIHFIKRWIEKGAPQ